MPAADPLRSTPHAQDSLALYRRRWTAWFSLPFGAIMCLAGIVFGVVVARTMRGGMGMAIGLGAMLFALAFGWMLVQGALRALRAAGPALVFDADGITWTNDGTTFIPWSSIERVAADQGDGDDLGIWFKAGHGQRAQAGAGQALRRALLGADQTIPLGSLVYNPKTLAATIARLHAAAP